ncbi:MAG: WG repeat-containing protein [Clostridia bacterium]|nr:WG repeat-containing protein [Clostridia bacterium]
MKVRAQLLLLIAIGTMLFATRLATGGVAESYYSNSRINNLIEVYDANGWIGLIADDGELVYPYSEYSYQIDTIQPSIIRVISWVDGMEKCALYNAVTKERTDFIYRQTYGGDTEDSLILVLDAELLLFGYVDIHFDEVIPCRFDDAQPFSCGLAYV